jgi:hypothetical protein
LRRGAGLTSPVRQPIEALPALRPRQVGAAAKRRTRQNEAREVSLHAPTRARPPSLRHRPRPERPHVRPCRRARGDALRGRADLRTVHLLRPRQPLLLGRVRPRLPCRRRGRGRGCRRRHRLRPRGDLLRAARSRSLRHGHAAHHVRRLRRRETHPLRVLHPRPLAHTTLLHRRRWPHRLQRRRLGTPREGDPQHHP